MDQAKADRAAVAAQLELHLQLPVLAAEPLVQVGALAQQSLS